jgi:hypothetical protein
MHQLREPRPCDAAMTRFLRLRIAEGDHQRDDVLVRQAERARDALAGCPAPRSAEREYTFDVVLVA